VNLRVAETEDSHLLTEWLNSVEFMGAFHNFPVQISKAKLEKQILEQKDWVHFVVETKDGHAIGWAAHYVSAPNFGWMEIGYDITPEQRTKGYGTETIQILTDYLFVTRELGRIQAVATKSNIASIRALEKAGYTKEGTLRHALWDGNGQWVDGYLYSILKEEWKTPKILKTASKFCC
jgi:RimJ/RimL family protein N-acetyltransferase